MSEIIKVFVLGGGYGTRLHPMTSFVPKVLMPVHSKPCIRWIVDNLVDQGFKDIVLCINDWGKEQFFHEFRDALEVSISVSNEPCGTAGEILTARRYISDTILVIYGDDLSFMDYEDLVKFHKEKEDAVATLALTSQVRLEVGVVKVDESDLITEYHEKPMLGTMHAWTGVSVLEPKVLRYISVGEDFAKDVFPRMMKAGEKLYGYVSDKEWLDVGLLSHYRQAIERAKEGELK